MVERQKPFELPYTFGIDEDKVYCIVAKAHGASVSETLKARMARTLQTFMRAGDRQEEAPPGAVHYYIKVHRKLWPHRDSGPVVIK